MRRACKKCRKIYDELKTCPECNEKLSENWKGVIIVVDPENSEIAKKLNITKPGKYALIVK